MAYDPSNLSPTDLDGLPWALAWTRFLLHDTDADNEIYSDTELTAVIEARAFQFEEADGTTTTYYRPHMVAAHLIVTDPDRATSESLLGSSVTVSSPGKIAQGIRLQNAWIDEAIEEATETYPPSGFSFKPAF